MKISKFTISVVLIAIIAISLALLWRINQDSTTSQYKTVIDMTSYRIKLDTVKGYRIEEVEDPDNTANDFVIYKDDNQIVNLGFITSENERILLQGIISEKLYDKTYNITNAVVYVMHNQETNAFNMFIDYAAKTEYVWLAGTATQEEIKDLISAMSIK